MLTETFLKSIRRITNSKQPCHRIEEIMSKRNKIRSRRGQGITEYATVIAFVCFIIAFAFSLARGTLFAAISDTYSNTASTLDRMNRAVHDHH
jgi:Flp pilus assembly pilin Flp